QFVRLDPVRAEAVQQRAPLLQRHAQPAQDDLLILLVGYPEPLAQARRLGVLAQQGQAQRVDRAPRDAVRAIPQGVLQPDRNLLGRPVRERDRADALRRDAKRADEMVDAGDEAERLPGAGSRHHEDGAEGCCNGAALLGQGVELHAGESRRRGAERLLKQPFPRSRRLTGKPSTRLLMLPGLPLLAAVTLAAQVADPRPPRPAPEPPPPTRVAAPRATQPPAIDGRDGDEDFAWDAVWDVATHVDSLGWTAEFRIPLSQLRYGRQRSHTFGFTIDRDLYRYAQRVSWPLFRQSKAGFVSQLGEISGLDD